MALMACALGLYLVDSSLLLYGNEGIVTTRGRTGWQVAFGSGIQLRGKELFVPSPLLPHRPVFRLTWSFAQGKGDGDPGWTAQRALLRPLAPFIWGMAGALFLLLPLGLYTRLGDRMLLAALVLLYANLVAALAWLAFMRARVKLTPRRLARLGFEALICPPFGLNLVRKISAETAIGEDLVCAARRLLGAEDWEIARDAFIARLDEEMQQEAEDPDRVFELQRYRQQLLGEAGSA
jgi:hypothetical protein